MEVRKIQTKISEQVAEQIERLIAAGDVKPGDKLPPVRELCEMFSVGRSAVRDAINTLKGKAMVEVRHGEGIFVRNPSEWRKIGKLIFSDERTIQDVYTVRKMLEIGTAELAARNRAEEHLDKMKRAIDDLQRLDNGRKSEADIRFHLALAESTGNELLPDLMHTSLNSTKAVLDDLHLMIAADEGHSFTILDQHIQIYEAVKRKDPGQASLAMRGHLEFVETLMRNFLDREGGAQ